MPSRSTREKTLYPSFFAFQDIIAAVIGVLLVIALLLTLEVIQYAETGPIPNDDSGDNDVKAELDRTLVLLDEANLEMRSLQKNLAEIADRRSLEEIERVIALCSEQRHEMARNVSALSLEVSSKKRRMAVDEMESGIAEMLIDLELAKDQLADIEQILEKETVEMREIEKAVIEQERNLLVQSKIDNQLLLIPELPDTTKEPVLAVVSGDKIEVSSFTDPEPVTTEFRGSPHAAVDKALETLHTANNYVVIFFRPSAADFFHSVRDYVRESGFQIGCDLVSEDTVLRLSR